MDTAIVLLAAGGSSRMGTPKQLLDMEGMPMARRVAQMLVRLNVGPVGVVIGGAADDVSNVLADVAIHLIRNERWQRGIGTSIQAGIVWAQSLPVESAMICLCDQPGITADHLHALLAAHTAAKLAVTDYGNTLGVPAIFSRSLFPALMALPDDEGAKSLFRNASLRLNRVRCEAARIDLDTPADVERWRSSKG